jgi:hypothetical protein
LVQALNDTAGAAARLIQVDSDDLAPVLAPLRGYLREHPDFESTVSAPSAMDDPSLARLCQYAVANNFRSHRAGIDLERLLAALPEEDRPATLRLEFEDGAPAYLGSTPGGLCLVPDGPAPATAFAPRAVFNELLTRGLDLNGALFAGRLVLEAESDLMPEALAQLSRLVDHLGVPA